MSKKNKRNKNKSNATKQSIRVEDSSVSPSGAGSRADRGRGYEPAGMRAGMEHVRGRRYHGGYEDGFYYRLWDQYWEAQKIVDIVPYDMTREGWRYEGADVTPEQIKEIENEAKRIKLIPVIRKALHYERLYGGAAVIIGSQELHDDASKALTTAGMGKGDLVFIRAIPRFMLTPTEIETDPLKENYQNPTQYTIRGNPVHRSRLLIFDGGGEPGDGLVIGGEAMLSRRDGFGHSILQNLYNDVIRADGSRQAAFHLLHLQAILLFKKEGGKGFAINKKGEDNLDKLADILDSISIYKGAILDNVDDIVTRATSMQGVSQFLEQELQVLSAASDIPAPRFLGEAPGGLNASGKGDLINYYDGLGGRQTNHLAPQLDKLMPVLSLSATGLELPVEIKFNSLLRLSDDQQADLRTKDFNNILGAVNAGIGDDPWAAKEFMERKIFLNDPLEDGGLGSGLENVEPVKPIV